MKKHLLFAAMAMLASVSSFALEVGQFVYTPQGRFQITGANLNANNAFNDLTGWTVTTNSEKTLEDLFVINASGCEEGLNSVGSLDGTAQEGMYYTFEPTSSSDCYVVSFKAKSSTLMSVRNKLTVWDGNNPSKEVIVPNVIRFAGNSANAFGETADEVVINTAEELTEEWQTFNYAIVGDGISRTYYFAFTGIPTTVEIADLQIAQAMQFADLRQRDAMVEKMEAYKNCYAWDAAILDDLGFDENLDNLKAIGDENGQAELEEQLGTCQEIIDDFLKHNMEDYLAGNSANYLGIREASGNLQKQTAFGDWSCVDRGFWSSGAYPDLGHYQYGNTWSNGNPGNAMGVTMQKELTVGSYVFAINGLATLREAGVSKNWELDEGMNPAYGVAYVVKIVDGAAADTVVSVVKDLESLNYTPFIATAKIEADGTYEFGFKVYCKEEYKAFKNGSVTYLSNASIMGKNANKYTQKQLAYEANVRAQITAGRDNLTKAAEYLADASYYWGKEDLQAAVDEIEPKIAAYEAMSQDDIIATYDEDTYEAGATNENAQLEHEVYDTATKYIIDANRTFVNVNDILNSLQVAIDNALATLTMRIYDSATGKADLEAAIATAKGIQAEMKASQYSEENQATIESAVADLNDAVALFKTTIPSTSITEIISVDFEGGATPNSETGLYDVAGVNTVMSIENFSENTPTTNEKGQGEMNFELGLDSNGEKVLPGVLRVGNGSATATIAEKEYGTNILKVSMDFWFVRLTDGHVGFDLTDINGDRVAGMYYVPYNNNLGTAGYDDFAIANFGNFFPSNTTGDAGSCADNNISHIECILDYGEGTMYLTSTNPSGMFSTEKVAFNKLAPTAFTVKSNYKNYPGRRCWFDNLKIEQIAAGPVNGINEMKVVANAKAAIYNLAGQKLTSAPAKGLYIQNGKKFVVK